MSILVTRFCLNQEEFVKFKKELEACAQGKFVNHADQQVTNTCQWPAIVISNITTTQPVECQYTVISKYQLLRILGITHDELKVELLPSSVDITPELFLDREV